MNKQNASLIKKICARYCIGLYVVRRGDRWCRANGEDTYINKSYTSGNQMWLGIYDDEAKELASFFHEVGHILDPIDWSVNTSKNVRYQIERWAWKIGFRLAENHGIYFHDSIKEWAKEQAITYS